MPRTLRTHLRPGLGGRLRDARERAGLSQRQLAFPGCTAAYISRLEADERTPSLQIIFAIAERLSVSGRWLATGETADPVEIEDRLMDALTKREQAVSALRIAAAALETTVREINRRLDELEAEQ